MRKTRKISFENTVAIIVDGKDEQRYIRQVRDNYPSPSMKSIAIKPELPEKKKVNDLFRIAREKVDADYAHVILIVDMDEIIKDPAEFSCFSNHYHKYLAVKNNTLSPNQKASHAWMDRLTIIVNTPCLEFWYLLHHRRTTRFYPNFAAMEADLKRLPGFADYTKKEDFYKSIYNKLGGHAGILKACHNAHPFSLPTASQQGCSEMHLFFDYFHRLDNINKR